VVYNATHKERSKVQFNPPAIATEGYPILAVLQYRNSGAFEEYRCA
jgi:hypothetical protein